MAPFTFFHPVDHIVMKFLQAVAILVLSHLYLPAEAGLFDEKTDNNQRWGISAGIRVASIPFDGDEVQASFVPLTFFENDNFYLDGLEGGIKLRSVGPWQLNVLAKARFFDISEQHQQKISWDVLDVGAQLRYQSNSEGYGVIELLSDTEARLYSNLRFGWEMQSEHLQWEPYLNLRIKSADFNSQYYGLGVENLDAGSDATVGVKLQYPLTRHIYLYGLASVTLLDDGATDSSYVDENWQSELFAGIAYFSDREVMPRSTLHNMRFMRVAHGWATPSDLQEMITGHTEHDSHNNQLTSLFYGHPLLLRALERPLDIYLVPGFVWHWSSSTQSASQEYVLGLKAFYTLYWPSQWRVGVAEGLSYVTQPTYIEQSELDLNDYQASNLMNYLGFSVDLNLGDLFGVRSIRDLWFGYAIHHRSGMFEVSSLFGRVKGGSNYETLYLQWDF